MKMAKFAAALLAIILGLTLTAAPLAEDTYGALRLQEEKAYQLREVVMAFLEETGLRLQWLSQAAERFPDEPLYKQALEMEQARTQTMLQQFAAWGFPEEPAEPPFPPEVPAEPEQALRALRGMAQRGMLMSLRLEENRDVPEEDRFQAHMWGHEYRQQLDDCDLKADGFGYSWAWQYENEEPYQEQNQKMNGPQGEVEPNQLQNQEQNQEMNGPQDEPEPTQEQNREQNQEQNSIPDQSGQNGQANGTENSRDGNGKSGD